MDTLSSAEQIDPRVKVDQESGGDLLGLLSVSGYGGGMPEAYPARRPVSVYSNRATIHPGLVELDLPLTALHVVSARRVGVPWTPRKAADAMWQLHAKGPGVDLRLRGSWVLLAQLGTLGHWPEPQ